jgi:hypothetical protein
MRYCTLLLTIAAMVSAQTVPTLPSLVKLSQDKPRAHPKLKLPKGCTVGPVIPGLTNGQGATPQGLAFWETENWFLISCYFHKTGHPSVVVAIDVNTGRLVRCLTLVEADGKAHTGHVGGLAVSDKYLWVGSGQLYRVPLAAVAAAKPVDHLQLGTPFKAACTASYVAYSDKRVWVGEFVSVADNVKGDPTHHLKDRNGSDKYAWVAGYALDANDDLAGAEGGRRAPPAAILSVRQKVQGMAFQGGQIVLSISYGRKAASTLADYADPLRDGLKEPHATVKVGDAAVPVWFLDGKNRQWDIDDFPPMTEGIAGYGKRLAVICESGAEEYQEGGRGPLDCVVYLTPTAGR